MIARFASCALRLVACALALACAGERGPEAAGPVPQELAFLDSALFDQQLSRSLEQGAPTVTVRFVSPVSVNALPERIDRWLYLVGTRHGNPVHVQADPEREQERGVPELVLSLGVKVYQSIQDQRLYGPAAGYGAIVNLLPGQGEITRIIFVRLPRE